jgi:hypothetical protein
MKSQGETRIEMDGSNITRNKIMEIASQSNRLFQVTGGELIVFLGIYKFFNF